MLDDLRYVLLIAAILAVSLTAAPNSGQGQTIYPVESPAEPAAESPTFELVLLADEPVPRPFEQGTWEHIEDAADGEPCVVVRGQQAGVRIEEAAFVAPGTTVSWSWKKRQGSVSIVQIGIRNPETGQFRYLGYAAGAWSEPASPDPTVEIFVSTELPREWVRVERPLAEDIQRTLGWSGAQITSFYVSPWDGEPGMFRAAAIRGVSPQDDRTLAREAQLRRDSRVGRGDYVPQRLRRQEEPRVAKFEASFEECAPGRNSGGNEWSAFGAIGNLDFNCIGRNQWVRYPAFELVFRLFDAEQEIAPGELESFRLRLVDGHLPAIWSGWQHDGLLYKVSAMTVPSRELGNFDLYKLEIQNLQSHPIASKLVAAVDGSPDLRLEANVVRGFGDSPFLVADAPASHDLQLRDWGLCDKRAKAYATGPGPGNTEPAIARYRLGLDGLPVVYRVRAERGKKYVVYLATTPHIGGHLVEQPKKTGELVYEYRVEGCPPKSVDRWDWIAAKNQPLCVGFETGEDLDGDGYIEVRAAVTSLSRIRHSCLSAVYVFPAGTRPESLENVYSGAMNGQCIWHIDVGATPEQSSQNQLYDHSDVGLARLRLHYTETVPPGATRTYWLRVPPIHRRQPVSMGYVAHAFRDVLPGEAVPPYSEEAVASLKQADTSRLEATCRAFWDEFFAKCAAFDLPDPVLKDMYLSRLATRAILDVNLNDGLSYNACSPFFYFDHAYRDQAYVIYTLDLAGLHDQAEKLLRVYCKDTVDVPQGLLAFDGKPLQLGMLPNGLWNTRPGQWDTQGQNIWALVQHYKLSGNRRWLEETAYPFVRRGAEWLVRSRHRHSEQIKDPQDPRYGLLEPGAMEVMEVGQGVHMYYLNAFAILGLREAADAARALGKVEDAAHFAAESLDLKRCLYRSLERTFKRTGLYEGHLWFGVEPAGVGMYGFWAHNCLVWPCRALDPHDPLLEGTWRKMEAMSNQWGGGLHSEGAGSFWPYIGVDRAVSYVLRGESDRALDYFCAMTDTAGGTLSWGEGYANRIALGDQPHMWADAQWLNLFRQLFAFEDEASLWITPALFRRWHTAGHRVAVSRLPTHFGDLDLQIEPSADGNTLRYKLSVTPRGDQAVRELDRILLFPRIPGGRAIQRVTVDGKDLPHFTRDCVILGKPQRASPLDVLVQIGPW